MEWFNGGVGEAIAAAKEKKAIFAVFVNGKTLNKFKSYILY